MEAIMSISTEDKPFVSYERIFKYIVKYELPTLKDRSLKIKEQRQNIPKENVL